MSKPVRLNETAPRIYQWTTDDAPCEPLLLGEHSGILVEVRGDLGGEGVQFRGGLTLATADEMTFLDEVRVTPALIKLPAVQALLPITKAKGVTILFKGLP